MLDLTTTHRIDGTGERSERFIRYYCGAVFVPKGTTFTRTYEVAAWWTEYTTTEDRWYPVFATRHHIYSTKWELSARVDVTVTAQNTPSLFGGVAYGSEPQGKNHRQVGREDVWIMSVTPQMFDDDTFMPVQLGFSAVRNFYTHEWGGFHYSDSWEWRPYSERWIEGLEPVPELCVLKYGGVVMKEET